MEMLVPVPCKSCTASLRILKFTLFRSPLQTEEGTPANEGTGQNDHPSWDRSELQDAEVQGAKNGAEDPPLGAMFPSKRKVGRTASTLHLMQKSMEEEEIQGAKYFLFLARPLSS